MATVNVFNMDGEQISQTELADEVFGIEPNISAMHQVVTVYLGNQRQGTQSTLTRTEVRGGGRKPWRQKGTGHARQGSTRAPQWVHGGIANGPKPRSYRRDVNKKVRRLAMKSALSSKVRDGELIVIDVLAMEEYRTKTIVHMLKALGTGKSVLIVTEEADEKIRKSAANIPGVKTSSVNTLNVYDILNNTQCIIAKSAIAKIEEVYA